MPFVRGLIFWPILMMILLSGCYQKVSLLSLPSQQLPGFRQQLLHKFDLPRGRKYRNLEFGGSVLDVDTKDYRHNDAIIIVRFVDEDGKSCGLGGLPPTTLFKERAGFVYLGGSESPRIFSRRVSIPEAAVRMEMGFSRFPYNNDRRVELNDFKCVVFSSALGDFIVDRFTWGNLGLLLMVLGVFFAVFTRKHFLFVLHRTWNTIKGFLMQADLSWMCLLFIMAFFFFVGVRMAKCGCDMASHISVANNMDIEDLLCPIDFWRRQPHFLWHLLVRLVKAAFHLEDSFLAAGLVNGFCYNACLIGIYAFLKRSFKSVDSCSLIFMAVAVCTVGCMMGPWLNLKHIYENSPNTWHNPTNMIVRTLAFPCVLLTARLLYKSLSSGGLRKIQWSHVTALGLILLLTELAKPNFMQIYLPAIFFYLLGRGMVNKISVSTFFQVLLALSIPCLLLLAQYQLWFGSGNNGSGGITLGFMKVIGQYEHSGVNMFYGVAFPVAALIVAVVRRKRHIEDILCWLMLLVGLAMRLFLFERGRRMMDGNFSWGYTLALYLVWVTSIRQYVDIAISQNTVWHRLTFWVLSILLFGHVITGFYKMYDMMCLGSGI